MEGKRLIEKIKLRKILSFGDQGEEIELQPLNIIIGQNASGKSNLIDVIKLLRSLPKAKGITTEIAKNGGVFEWIWKGKREDEFSIINFNANFFDRSYQYEISFWKDFTDKFNINNEIVKSYGTNKSINRLEIEELISNDPEFSELFQRGLPQEESIIERDLRGKNFNYILYFRIFLPTIKIYGDLITNRNAEIRKPQVLDLPNNFLEEDASNLGLVLNDLEHKGNTKDIILENLRKFYPLTRDYLFRLQSNTIQLYLREESLDSPISAMRLSDGTLRYLCLLAILCHPEPPPLICIEEPETGLHPDILPTIAELMKDAAQRTQLIVTTHSDILVSAFSDMPEAVMVCEKDEDGTHFKRLNEEELKIWMEEYTDLGEIWLRGGIGGTRW